MIYSTSKENITQRPFSLSSLYLVDLETLKVDTLFHDERFLGGASYSPDGKQLLVTGSGAPTCAMVYKLTERENSAGEMQPVAKKSKDKATVPGRKLAFRSYEYSLADCEHVISGSEDKLAAYQPEDGWKDLLVDYVTNGENHSEYQGHDAIVNAHNYRAQALAELPIGAQSLMKGDPVIPTEVTVL